MRTRALLIAFLVVAGSILTAVEAKAAATVYIYKVYFDSPGSDTGSNSSLNAEYVVIRNGDNVAHSISGWTVRDKAGHVYKFGSLRLGAGKQAVIHTGDGTIRLPQNSLTTVDLVILITSEFQTARLPMKKGRTIVLNHSAGCPLC
jgi:hypothetical protein